MQLLGGKQTDPERLRIPCFPRRPLSTSGFIFFKWQDFAVENTSYTRHTGLLSAPAREAYLLTVRHPDGSGRNYTTHTRKVRSRLLAATKLFDRVRDPRIPLVKGAPGVHRRFGARSRRRGSLSQSAMSLSGQIRSPARIVMWLCQESGMNFTYRVVTGLLKRCHTWVSLSVLPVNVKDPASFVTGTHPPDRYTSTL